MHRNILRYILSYFCILGIHGQNPQVEIPQGILMGDTRTNIDGGSYYAFKSIPYGRPPIGELRFRAPQPAVGWNGTFNATEEIPACVQFGGTSGQEDCLYLNVYTPRLLGENTTNLAVMVWIYGGAFQSGSAVESTFGGQYLLTKDIVLVTINYRVGIFGFLSLDDPNLGVTGNAGLKDQVLALEWVRDNVEYFGGDPNNVLIFGQSAGGMSVSLLLLSPMARGLFHKAISQSGDATTGLMDAITRNNGAVIAERLGIQTQNWEEMLTSLQEVSAYNLSVTEQRFDTGLFRTFSAPIVEVPSNEPTFLDGTPMDVIRAGDYNQVPHMTGICDAEGLLFQYLSTMNTGESLLIDDFTAFIPNYFNIAAGSVLEELVAVILQFFYYGDTEPSRDNITAAVQLTTDYGFAFPAYSSTREKLRTAENPIYFYYFTAKTNLSTSVKDEIVATYPGASHSDDVLHLFYNPSLPTFESGTVEERVVRSMIELWTNFAIYGDPTPDNSTNFTWQPLREDQFNYVEIATEETFSVVNSTFTTERLEFWWALYEEYGVGPINNFLDV